MFAAQKEKALALIAPATLGRKGPGRRVRADSLGSGCPLRCLCSATSFPLLDGGLATVDARAGAARGAFSIDQGQVDLEWRIAVVELVEVANSRLSEL